MNVGPLSNDTVLVAREQNLSQRLRGATRRASGAALRREVNRALRDVTGAAWVGNFVIDRRADGHRTIADFELEARPATADTWLKLVGGTAPSGSVLKPDSSLQRRPFDLEHPHPDQVNRFRQLDQDLYRQRLRQKPIWDRYYAPLETADQLRMTVYSGRRFVRWVGCLLSGDESARFGPQLTRHLNRNADLVAAAFVQAAASERADLESGSRRIAILDADGHLLARTDSLRPWLRKRERTLAPVVHRLADTGQLVSRAWVDGWRLEITRLDGPSTPRWLVEVHPTEPVLLSRTAGLTPRQREVAELLVAGATYEEIARGLGISVNTVKYHARRVYHALDVTTRSELVAEWPTAEP